MFLDALARDLEHTQRAIPSSCLFCVPQPQSLVADYALTLDDVYTHLLSPAGDSDAPISARAQRPGEYETLNGKCVSIQGSHVVTGRGFAEPRKVRILLSEPRVVHHQRVTVLHLSRPLQGGVAVPEDPNELDVATLRRLTAILRAFPENELAFVDLDATVAHVRRICARPALADKYAATLPALLRDEFDAAVDAMLRAGSFESSSGSDDGDDDGDNSRANSRGNGDGRSGSASHLLQIQQVVECYLLEQLHVALFPRVVASCRTQEAALRRVLWRMRHYSPQDFGIRAGLQSAVDALRNVAHHTTPLAMLLALKRCLDAVSDAITHSLKQHSFDLGRYQLTTDDILDQLLYVLVQTYTRAETDAPHHDALDDVNKRNATQPAVASDAPSTATGDIGGVSLVAVLQYIADYHFINSNTTALGFTVANFQVAVEFFLLRAEHIKSCSVCALATHARLHGSSSTSSTSDDTDDVAPTCAQSVLVSQCEVAYARNVRDMKQLAASERESVRHGDRDSASRSRGDNDQTSNSTSACEQLAIVGDWSVKVSSSAEDFALETGDANANDDDDDVNDGDVDANGLQSLPSDTALGVHRVHLATSSDHSTNSNGSDHSRPTQVVAMSAGQRFFAAVSSRGELFTWGDRSGARLGYAASAGESRRVVTPRRVSALAACHVLHVACGAFHALAADVNGHVFAWGSNARGQLGLCGDDDLIAATASVSATSARSSPSKLLTTVETPTLVTQLCGAYVGAVACGAYHSLALTSTGRVFTWGCNRFAKLGRVTETSADARPTALDENWTARALDLRTVRCAGAHDDASLRGVVRRIAAGADHSLAVTYDGAVFTWGRGDSGQLGHGSVADVARPTHVAALSGTSARDGFCVVDADGGSDFSLFLVAAGAAFVAGRDPSRARGADNSIAHSHALSLFPELVRLRTPPRVPLSGSDSSSDESCELPAPTAVVGVSCGDAHFALLLSDDSVLVSSCSDSSSSNNSNDDDERIGEQDSRSSADANAVSSVDTKSRRIGEELQTAAAAAATACVTRVEALACVKRIACGGSHTLVLS